MTVQVAGDSLNPRRQRARITLLLTAVVIALDVVGFRTNWLLPHPRFCGTILADGRWREDIREQAPNQHPPHGQRVCVREIIHPYSRFSGSATVALSVQKEHGEMQLYDIQFFIARKLGRQKHNDTPGDWIFLSQTTYNSLGWRVGDSPDQVASWSSHFYTPAIRRQIWLMVQHRLGDTVHDEALSFPRRVGIFVAINGPLIISTALLLYVLVELLGLHALFLSGGWKQLSYQRVLNKLKRMRLGRLWLRRSLLLATTLTVSALLVVSRFSDRFTPRAFWCKVYSGSWRACLHEIYYLPTTDLRMMVLGVKLQKPDQTSLYAVMQFFTALPKDKIGFVDVPGSWHFQDRLYYNKSGWLQERRQMPLSSIVDPLLPRQVQLALWHDIAHHVQDQYKARRLSVQSKLLEVSRTYLFMLLTVLLATWTALNYLELWILDYEHRSATAASRARSENTSTS